MKSLAELRQSKGLTQTFMAEQLNIAVSTYNQYENGKRRVPYEIAEKISKILKTPREHIFLPSTFAVRKTKAS